MNILRKSLYEIGAIYNEESISCIGSASILIKNPIEFYEVTEVPANIGEIFKYEKTNEEFILKKGSILFNIESGMVTFDEVFNKEIRIDAKTGKSTITKIDLEDFINIRVLPDGKSYNEICLFIADVIYNLNPYVSENLLNKSIIEEVSLQTIKNLLKISVFSLEGAEKILKTHPAIIKNNINKENFNIGNDGELTKVVELPKFAIDVLSDRRFKEVYIPLQFISKDLGSNDLKVFVEFLEMYLPLIRKRQSSNQVNIPEFANKVYKILTNYKDYKMKALLSYLIRQNTYFGKFDFPDNEVNLLYDYLDICKRYGFDIEKYPSILTKSHDVVARNAGLLGEAAKDELFKQQNAKYTSYMFTGEHYSIVVPKDINDLIQEGNVLNHCVGSYVDRIIDGRSKVFFVRKNDELTKPYVTCELNDKNNVVQVRGRNNSTPPPDVKRFVSIWNNRVRRI